LLDTAVYNQFAETRFQNSTLEAWVSPEPLDPQWDSFLELMPSGRHEQTSLWAQVKAMTGWRTIRVVLSANEQIQGGFQILWTNKPPLGRIGYISYGPVVNDDNQDILDFAIDQLKK